MITRWVSFEFYDQVKQALEQQLNYSLLLSQLKQAGFKGPQLFKPLRLLWTGTLIGPPLESLFNYWGPSKLLQHMAVVEHKLLRR